MPCPMHDLVARVFATRNAAHAAHFQTNRYAAHVALGEFYGAIIETIDEIVEVYQGLHGLLGEIPAAPQPSITGIIEHITREAEWINANRAEICMADPTIDNLIDELRAIYLRTAYKLRHLA